MRSALSVCIMNVSYALNLLVEIISLTAEDTMSVDYLVIRNTVRTQKPCTVL